MFVQVLRGKVKSAAEWSRLFDEWNDRVRPAATGFLGATTGVTDSNEVVAVARFESEDAARANSESAAQSAWYEEAVKVFEGEPSFQDCTEVDLSMGGGSDAAGFVQVMQGRAKQEAELRREAVAIDEDIRRLRPDVLGGLFAWHGDGGGFTQVAYFTTEAEARKNEATMTDDPSIKRFLDLIDGPMTFYDLKRPRFA